MLRLNRAYLRAATVKKPKVSNRFNEYMFRLNRAYLRAATVKKAEVSNRFNEYICFVSTGFTYLL
jgi:hypothetical protein